MAGVIETLAYPGVFVVLGITGMMIFRKPISAKIHAASSVTKEGVKFEHQADLQRADVTPAIAPPNPPAVNEAPPPPDAATAAIEAEIVGTLSEIPYGDQNKRAWLVRAVAQLRLTVSHEKNYRLIMGSQLTLLLRANTDVPLKIEVARALYDQAVAAFPNVYDDFRFDEWIGWPTMQELIERRQDGNNVMIKTTDIGRHFLHYLIENNLTAPKAG